MGPKIEAAWASLDPLGWTDDANQWRERECECEWLSILQQWLEDGKGQERIQTGEVTVAHHHERIQTGAV